MDVAIFGPAGRRRGFFVSGFTLPELLVTLAVAGILAGVAVPGLHAIVATNRRAAQHNALVAHLSLARSEAIKRGREVLACLSADGSHCGHGDRWDQGWIVFVDRDEDRSHDAGEPLLQTHAALPGTRLTYSGFPSDRYIRFRPSGLTKSNGTFVFCNGGRGHSLIVATTGRARRATTYANGTPVSCPE